MCVVPCTLTHQKSSIFFVDALLQSAVFRCAINVAAGTAAPLLLLLLLLSAVLCACTVMIALLLVVVITRDFESQLKSSGRVTHSQSFKPELPWIQALPAAAAGRLDYRLLCPPYSRVWWARVWPVWRRVWPVWRRVSCWCPDASPTCFFFHAAGFQGILMF